MAGQGGGAELARGLPQSEGDGAALPGQLYATRMAVLTGELGAVSMLPKSPPHRSNGLCG